MNKSIEGIEAETLSRLTIATLLHELEAPDRQSLQGRYFMMIPGGVPHSLASVTLELSLLPKPLSCYAFRRRNITVIGWWSRAPDDFDEETNYERLKHRDRESQHGLRIDCGVVLSGLSLSVDQYLAWRRAYSLFFLNIFLRESSVTGGSTNSSLRLQYSSIDEGSIEGDILV